MVRHPYSVNCCYLQSISQKFRASGGQRGNLNTSSRAPMPLPASEGSLFSYKQLVTNLSLSEATTSMPGSWLPAALLPLRRRGCPSGCGTDVLSSGAPRALDETGARENSRPRTLDRELDQRAGGRWGWCPFRVPPAGSPVRLIHLAPVLHPLLIEARRRPGAAPSGSAADST